MVALQSFSHERVHSLEDLNFFLNRKIKEEIIIFSGHGDEIDGFQLSNKEFFNRASDIRCHPKNQNKLIIFSSCLIGKSDHLLKGYYDFFAARAVFAYRHIMDDKYCFLIESLLLLKLEKSFNSSENPLTDAFYGKFVEETNFIKNMNKKNARKHPLVMFS